MWLRLILCVIVLTESFFEILDVNLTETCEWHVVNEYYATWLSTILDVLTAEFHYVLTDFSILACISVTLDNDQWVMADAVCTVLTCDNCTDVNLLKLVYLVLNLDREDLVSVETSNHVLDT